MAQDFVALFTALKPVLVKYARRMVVQTDTPAEYSLVTKAASPFPQHKGGPLYFGSVRIGKAYVSFHLMPLYMVPGLVAGMSPELKKRMHGKSCLNFKTAPSPELVAELKKVTDASFQSWAEKKWLRRT
jgi:hypothetical protein